MNAHGRMKRLALLGIAVVLLVSVSVGTALAYFTTYATAKGGHTLEFGPGTEIKEEFAAWTKTITAVNTGETDCYVRVKAFTGSRFALTYPQHPDFPQSAADSKWSYHAEDGFWYYSDPLPGGQQSQTEEPLKVLINLPAEFSEKPEKFNVVIVQECTEVLYHEDGTPYADWNKVADTSSENHVVEGAD